MQKGGEYHARDVRLELHNNTQYFFQSFLDKLIIEKEEQRKKDEELKNKQMSFLD